MHRKTGVPSFSPPKSLRETIHYPKQVHSIPYGKIIIIQHTLIKVRLERRLCKPPIDGKVLQSCAILLIRHI